MKKNNTRDNKVYSTLTPIAGRKSKDFLYVFMHVGKCAGVTINLHIKNNYSPEEYLRIADGKYRDKASIEELINSMTEEQRSKINVIFGQLAYYGIHNLINKEPRYFTFLRDPVSRTISHYNYLAGKESIEVQKYHKVMSDDGKIVPFEEWLENYKNASNYMVRVLYQNREGERIDIDEEMNETHLEVVKETLKKFYFVGITENSKQDMAFIFNRLGIGKLCKNANVSKKFFVPENLDETRELILEKNILDQKLYDFALELNREIMTTRIN